MILSGNVVDVRSTGVQSSKGFNIAVSGKAFRILSDGYKNNIEAIVRELSTNAIDAHLDAKNPSPFRVQLPNFLESSFKIRDFGTGLSPDKLETLYVTYFGSDKTGSNDAIGCLGLGSKTPFSYVNSFSVTSYHNGMKWMYIACIGEDETPQINLMHSEATSEPNGLEISFAVKPNDHDAFKRAAQKIYSYFKPANVPTVTGQKDFKVNERKFRHTSNGWRLLENENSGRYYYARQGQDSYAIMGNICYPIDKTQFALHPNIQALLGMGLEIDFGIGDLDITPFREDLQYTKRTSKLLLEKLHGIIDEIRQIVETKVSKATCYYDACTMYCEWLTGDNKDFVTICKLGNVTWGGKNLVEQLEIRNYKSNRVTLGYNGRAKSHNRHVNFISFQEKNTFFENDVKTGAIAAARRAIEDKTYTNILVVTFADDAERTKFKDELGLVDARLIKVSTLPKPARQKRGKQGNVFEFDIVTHNWKQTSIDLNKGGYYAAYRGGSIVIKGGSIEHRHIRGPLENIGSKLPANFYGVHANTMKKLAKLKNWKPIEDFVTKELEAFITKHNVLEMKALAANHTSRLENKYLPLLKAGVPVVKTDVRDFIAELEKIVAARNKTSVDNVSHAELLASRIRYDLSGKCKASNIATLEDAILERYPMLKFVDCYSRLLATESRVIVEYINSL